MAAGTDVQGMPPLWAFLKTRVAKDCHLVMAQIFRHRDLPAPLVAPLWLGWSLSHSLGFKFQRKTKKFLFPSTWNRSSSSTSQAQDTRSRKPYKGLPKYTRLYSELFFQRNLPKPTEKSSFHRNLPTWCGGETGLLKEIPRIWPIRDRIKELWNH